MEKKLLNTINALDNLMICNCCGGYIQNGICDFCEKHYPEFDRLVKNLENGLKNKQMGFKLFIELLNIRNLNIPFVNKLILENVKYYRDYLNKKFNDGEYEEVIEALSNKNAYSVVNPEETFRQITKEFYLNGASNVSDDAYLKFLKLYIDKILHYSNFRDLNNHRPLINFISDEEMQKIVNDCKCSGPTHGVCIQGYKGLHKIKFNKDSILNRKNESLIKNMQTVYHEFQHIIQENYYNNSKRYSLIGLLIAKDSILEGIIQDYYSINYEILPAEANANYHAISAVICDLKALSIYNGELKKELDDASILSFNPYRVHENEQVDINELFDSFEIKADVLDKFPILSLEYKIEEDHLVKRPREEIEELASSNNDLELTYIFNYILERFEQKKEFK